jgi:tRNA threonylcarbamoyl adenosine modification protein YjeE
MIIKSLDNLNSLSVQIGKKLNQTDCIMLYGEIGTGKTTFTRSLVNFLQKKERVNQTVVLSPTFNLLYEYEIKDLKILHYDLYRLSNEREITQLGIFKEDEACVKIIEWPELIKEEIPNRLELRFKYFGSENQRSIEIKGFGKWKNFKIDEL